MIERKTFIPFGNSADASIDYLLGIIEDARVTTLQRIEGISTEELHWQYAEGWNSISVLLSHFISIEHFFNIAFIQQRELTEKEKAQHMPGLEMGEHIPQLITDQPVAYYIRELEISRKQLIEQLKTVSTEDFYKKRTGYNSNTGYNMAWALYHAAEDEVHHRGQISIIRKLYKEHRRTFTKPK